MAKDVRERMVAGATKLLATKGLQATSFSEVIELTDTPRGSIYHHFPGGKDELVLAALDQACQQMLASLGSSDGASAEEVLGTVTSAWRKLLEGSQATTGCAAVAVTVATESDELLGATARVFSTWHERLTALFAGGGLTADKAAAFAATVLATVEGAVVIARAERNLEAYDRAVGQLPTLLAALKA